MKGIDYAWLKPRATEIKNNGYGFVGRYLSNTPEKNISEKEIIDLRNEGIEIVLFWESSAMRPLSGMDAGKSDTDIALTLISNLPVELNCIYFACDYDFNKSNISLVKQYFKGIGKYMPLRKVGCYGSYYVVKSLLDANLCTYAWQTSAWSKGKWDDRVNIKQTGQTVVGSIQCDLNESVKEDFGQC